MSKLGYLGELCDYSHLPKCGIDKCEECEAFQKGCIGFVPTFGSFREEESGDELKFDNGKPRCDLVPGDIIAAIGYVRSYRVSKYMDEDNYKKVEPKRYRAALMRHVCAWLKNPFGKDEESGLPHLWHIACNVAFLIELDKEDNE